MRCEGGVTPVLSALFMLRLSGASGGVAVQASSAAAVPRSRSESSSMLHSPSLTFSHWLKFPPTMTVLTLQRGPQQGKGRLFAH
jgi:hypothetical protein